MKARNFSLLIISVFILIIASAASSASSTVSGTNATLTIYSSPAAGTIEQNTPITFYANYTNKSTNLIIEFASCKLTFNTTTGYGPYSMIEGSSNFYYDYDQITSTAGSYKYTINCSRTGYDNLSANENFVVSATTLPTITIQSPSSNTAYTSGTINLSYSASDALSGINSASCKYSVNGGSNTSLSNCQNTTITKADGNYNITIYASDSLGNTNSATVTNITVDSTPPIDPIIYSLPSSTNQSSISLVGYVNESEANISATAYKTDYSSPLTAQTYKTSSVAGTYYGSCISKGAKSSGDSSLTLDCSGSNLPQVGRYIEISGQTPPYYKRYNITSQTGGSPFYTVAISPSLNEAVADGATVKVYSTQTYDGWFNISVTLNQGVDNIIVVSAKDKYGNLNTPPTEVSITHVNTLNLSYSTFSSNFTSSFSSLNISNLTNPYVGIYGVGQINFSGSGINITGYDLDSNINISSNYAYLNNTAIPNLNVSATITFFSLNYSKMPVIYVTNNSGTYICASPLCSILNYTSGRLVFNVSHFSAYASGANSNLSTSDSAGGISDTSTTVTFRASYLNSTDGAPITGAACTISFNDSVSGAMNYSLGEYTYPRTFSTTGNKTYNVTCSHASFETLRVSDSITITSGVILAPTLWAYGSVTYNATISVIGFISKSGVNITALVRDQNQTISTLQSQISGADSTLIGQYTVVYDRIAGNTSIVLNGSGVGSILGSHYLEFSGHNRTFFQRYDIQTIGPAGPTAKIITFTPALEDDVLANETVYVYSSSLPSGYFNISSSLFPDITNYIDVWGEDSDGNIGPISSFTILYNTTPPVITYSGTVNDTGITTISENLNFTWSREGENSTYEIAIGTEKYPDAGYDSLQAWLPLVNITQYNATYNLTIDTTYYASIRILNGSFASNVVSSNGIIYIDVTPPICTGQCVLDGGNWTNNPMISASWSFVENESSIAYYEYEVGTDSCYGANSSNTYQKTQTTQPYATINIANPVNNATYYFNVWAKNTETLRNSTSQCYSSVGTHFDNEVPHGGNLSYPSGKLTVNQVVIDHYTGIDNYSGISRAEIWQKSSPIYTYDGSCGAFGDSASVLSNVSIGSSSYTATLTDGFCYQFELHVFDYAGNHASYTTGGINYNVSSDSTPPSPVNITDGGYFTNSRDLAFSWTQSIDADSGIKGYYYRLYKGYENGSYITNIYPVNTSGINFTQSSVRTISLTNLGLDDSIKDNAIYFLEVFAVNNFDIASNHSLSDGIAFFDNAPPGQLSVVSVNTDEAAPYFIITNTSDVNITVQGEPSETCQVSLNDIDFLGFGNPLVIRNFTTNSSSGAMFSLNGSYISEGLNTIYVVCRDMNGNTQNREINTEITFTIDTTPPTITMISPANGSTITGIEYFVINVTDYAGVKSANYRILNASNNQTYQQGTLYSGQNTITANFQAVPTTQLFYIVVNATDNYDRNTNKTFVYLVDNTMPKITYLNNKSYYNADFSLNFTFEMFSNYTVNVSLNGEQKSITLYNSAVQNYLENISVNISASSQVADWPEGNYTVSVRLGNVFGKNATNTTWFVIDRTPPDWMNATISPSGVYKTDDVLLSIIFNDTNLDTVTFRHDAENGSAKDYELIAYVPTSSNLSINSSINIEVYNLSLVDLNESYARIRVSFPNNLFFYNLNVGQTQNIDAKYNFSIRLNNITYTGNISNSSIDISAGYILENITNNTFIYRIYSSNLSTNETVDYTWIATDFAGNTMTVPQMSFTVQNRNPYFSLPDNYNLLNKEDYQIGLSATDSDEDNITIGVKSYGNNISVNIINITANNKTYYYAIITPDQEFANTTWIIFNASDPYGGYNESINITLNVSDSVGQVINFDSDDYTRVTYSDYINLYTGNLIVGSYQNEYKSITSPIKVATPENNTIADLLYFFEISQIAKDYKIMIDNMNISQYPVLNISYHEFNKSLINESQLFGGNYTIRDAFVFSIDNETYNGSYTVLWNYANLNVSDTNSTYLRIFKVDINYTNSTEYNISYSTAVAGNSLTVNTSADMIWGTFTNFSLFILAEEKATSETCSNNKDDDHDGSVDEGCSNNNNNNPPSGGPSGGTTGGSPGGSLGGGFAPLPNCTDGKKNQNEVNIDCGGVCGGYWYQNSCHSTPQATCNDRIKNQGETGIDCGGPCSACVQQESPRSFETCFDNQRNQNENAPDCGGVCGGYWYNGVCNQNPEATCSDGLQNQGEENIDCGGPCSACENKLFGFSLSTLMFILAGIIIVGAAAAFVLARKQHQEPYDYKMPAAPAEEPMWVEEPQVITVESAKKQREERTDLGELINFVNKSHSKGVPNSAIKITLLKNGWPQEMIEEAFDKTHCTRKLKELEEYIAKAKSHGHSEAKIRQTLLEADWAEHFIDMVLGEVHVIHDDFEKVEAYAKKMLSKGYNREDVIKTLTDIGWEREAVEQCID